MIRVERAVNSVMTGPADHAIHTMVGTMRAALGLPPDPWYRRHREAFVSTGDPIELVRMERHV